MRRSRGMLLGTAVLALILSLVGVIPTSLAGGSTGEVSGQSEGSTVAPFFGSVWISARVLTPASSSDFTLTRYVGVASVRTYDRRVPGWTRQPSHIFEGRFECGQPTVRVVVNGEFPRKRAAVEARRYAHVLGQLPPGLRESVKELWIHRGDQPAGGGHESVLIHTDEAEKYWTHIEEILLHEAAHTSLDPNWGARVGRENWATVSALDGRVISAYAAEHPGREDIAESYGAYAAWTVLNRRKSDTRTAALIYSTIPHRLDFLVGLGPEYVPATRSCPVYGSPIAPSRVTTLHAQVIGSEVLVSWRPPKSWGASSTRQFQYRVGGEPWVSTTSPYVRFLLPEVTSLIVRIRAVNEAGAGPASRIWVRSEPPQRPQQDVKEVATCGPRAVRARGRC